MRPLDQIYLNVYRTVSDLVENCDKTRRSVYGWQTIAQMCPSCRGKAVDVEQWRKGQVYLCGPCLNGLEGHIRQDRCREIRDLASLLSGVQCRLLELSQELHDVRLIGADAVREASESDPV